MPQIRHYPLKHLFSQAPLPGLKSTSLSGEEQRKGQPRECPRQRQTSALERRPPAQVSPPSQPSCQEPRDGVAKEASAARNGECALLGLGEPQQTDGSMRGCFDFGPPPLNGPGGGRAVKTKNSIFAPPWLAQELRAPEGDVPASGPPGIEKGGEGRPGGPERLAHPFHWSSASFASPACLQRFPGGVTGSLAWQFCSGTGLGGGDRGCPALLCHTSDVVAANQPNCCSSPSCRVQPNKALLTPAQSIPFMLTRHANMPQVCSTRGSSPNRVPRKEESGMQEEKSLRQLPKAGDAQPLPGEEWQEKLGGGIGG